MSSSNKFESGLNNWIGTDKPARTDFVSDNEILTGNAMWKATYDTQNNETDIFGYTDAQLATAIRNDGFTQYTHTMQGADHVLTVTPVIEGHYDNIKFVATQPYVAGQAFVVNGLRCQGYTMDGRALSSNFFATSAIVICFQAGNKLWFSGSGTVDALLRSGGQMTGSLKAYTTARSDTDVKNIRIVESNGTTAASTSYLIGRRKS